MKIYLVLLSATLFSITTWAEEKESAGVLEVEHVLLGTGIAGATSNTITNHVTSVDMRARVIDFVDGDIEFQYRPEFSTGQARWTFETDKLKINDGDLHIADVFIRQESLVDFGQGNRWQENRHIFTPLNVGRYILKNHTGEQLDIRPRAGIGFAHLTADTTLSGMDTVPVANFGLDINGQYKIEDLVHSIYFDIIVDYLLSIEPGKAIDNGMSVGGDVLFAFDLGPIHFLTGPSITYSKQKIIPSSDNFDSNLARFDKDFDFSAQIKAGVLFRD